MQRAAQRLDRARVAGLATALLASAVLSACAGPGAAGATRRTRAGTKESALDPAARGELETAGLECVRWFLPLDPVAKDPGSQRTAEIARQFLARAREVLKDDFPANFFTMRGIDKRPAIPTFSEVYGLKAGAVAVYPMYRGLARLVSMDVLDAGQTLEDQCARLEQSWNDYDFFFMHYKYTDSTGEDGNFPAKVERIEQLDAVLPRIQALKPDVLVVTGDHSTPSKMKSHSWHPVPTLLVADNCRPDACTKFGEATCLQGGLGQFQAKYLMTLAMAHAGRLEKYGA